MFLDDYGGAICQTGVEESVEHFFLMCSFAVHYWNNLGLNIGLNIELYRLLEVFMTVLQVPFFIEIIVLMSWSIWGS